MKPAIRRDNAYTLIELLMVILIVALATVAYEIVRAKHGPWPAAAASALAILAAVWLVVLFYRWSWSRDKRQLTELREKYRSIYQVKELPADARNIIKPEWAEIQTGDYGWEARPSRRDGLIHLQGLTKRWQVVWHAGFRPEQIEKVADKTASQYDYWAPDWAKRLPNPTPPPPPCPFPVQERSTPTMGLPHHSGHYFEDYPAEYYQSPSRIESPPHAPVMTAAEFIAWHKAIRRQFLTWTFLFIAMAFVTSRVCFYMDRIKPAGWIQILAGCGIISAFVIFFVLWNKSKHNIKKRGFQCPACGNEITCFSGRGGWVQKVLCNRCGAKVIEFNGIHWKTIAPP